LKDDEDGGCSGEGAGSAADQHALLLAGERFEGDCRKGEK